MHHHVDVFHDDLIRAARSGDAAGFLHARSAAPIYTYILYQFTTCTYQFPFHAVLGCPTSQPCNLQSVMYSMIEIYKRQFKINNS